ncbi:MAG: D-2-hydroxyacid dehydrogenase [Candidatus Metalachnospira sp.]|nr:D-2-hydroxyacid dehydrogenase [Candidatus Metalachnospira sp.]
MTNVLILSPCNENHKMLLSSAGGNDCSFTILSKSEPDDVLKREIDKADVIIGEPDVALIKDSPNLKLLQLTMAGTDKYTQSDDYPANVILANASGAFGAIISQYVIGAILNICHKFYIYRDNQKKGVWKDSGIETSLIGKRVLIIGAGNIGSSIAEKLSVFGTTNIGIRRNTSDIRPHFLEMHPLEELDEQLPLADVVIGCIPNSDYTFHLFDEHKFMLMKDNAIFVNVGRGSLVVQEDLINALKSGHLTGAALDVTTPEPLPSDNPLWYVDNLLITPHISGQSFGHDAHTTDLIYKICADNLNNFVNNKPLKNVIDFSKFKK